MKRSKFVRLSLIAVASVTVSGCGSDDPTVTATKKFTFQSIKECSASKIPVDVCSAAYMSAMSEHGRLAPTYATQADCEADFLEGYCEVDSKGRYMPHLGGFELTAAGDLAQSQLDQAKASSAANSIMSGGAGFLAGLLIGDRNSDGVRYYSEPIYRYRDYRGDYSESTLKRRIDTDRSFKGVANNPYLLSTVSGQPASGSVNVQAAVSRGGFGSQSAARSGWGGSRSIGG